MSVEASTPVLSEVAERVGVTLEVAQGVLGDIPAAELEGKSLEHLAWIVRGQCRAAAERRQGEPVVVVEVRDHGHGVPPEAAEKVFQRFYRSDTSRNRETGGSGLGLAIVLGIVAAHKGTVQMLQTPGGGATVHIELPPAPAW